MLSKTHRFHGLNSLHFVHKQGTVIRSDQLNLKCVVNSRRSSYRVAVVVSKKVSKSAVVRNRIRRRLYEAARLELQAVQQSYDLAFIVHQSELATMPAETLQTTVRQLLRKAGVL